MYQVEGQGFVGAAPFRFVAEGGATAWGRLRQWKPRFSRDWVLRGPIRISGRVTDPAGQPVAGALVGLEARGAPSEFAFADDRSPGLETRTDASGRFEFEVAGNPYYLVEVATVAGQSARHLVARADAADPFAKLPIPMTREARGVCELPPIVVPTSFGGLRMTIANPAPPGGWDVVLLPLDALSGLESRRVAVKSTLVADAPGLPEGDYAAQLVPRGSQAINLFGGAPWGTRVHVTAGRVTEARVSR